jgi:hypothetical protein
MLSDELFLKAELNKKIGLKTSKKGPGAPVIGVNFGPYSQKVRCFEKQIIVIFTQNFRKYTRQFQNPRENNSRIKVRLIKLR